LRVMGTTHVTTSFFQHLTTPSSQLSWAIYNNVASALELSY